MREEGKGKKETILKKINDLFKPLRDNLDVIEIIVFVVCIIGSITIMLTEMDKEWKGKIITYILAIITTSIFSKISTGSKLKEEQKKFAIIAYRHSKNLSSKMDISQKKYGIIKNINCKNIHSCPYYQNMQEVIEDLLIFKNDTEENIEDVSTYISEDIINIKKIKNIDDELNGENGLISQSQDDKIISEEEINKINTKISEKKNSRENYVKKIDKQLYLHYINLADKTKELNKIINIREMNNNISDLKNYEDNNNEISKYIKESIKFHKPK